MKKETIRKILLLTVVIIGTISICYALVKSFESSIDSRLQEVNYDEKDIANLEIVLKEYYENDFLDENTKRSMVLYKILNSDFINMYMYENETIEDYINRNVTSIDSDIKWHKEKEYNYNDVLIKPGDYHALAESLLRSENQTIIERSISDSLCEIEEIVTEIIIVIFVIIYVIIILRFIFLNTFSNKTFIKNIIKFAITLIAIFIANIITNIVFEKIINYLGDYKGMGFFQLASGLKIINYGVLPLLGLLIVFILSVVLNNIFNIKDIIKYFKERKMKTK